MDEEGHHPSRKFVFGLTSFESSRFAVGPFPSLIRHTYVLKLLCFYPRYHVSMDWLMDRSIGSFSQSHKNNNIAENVSSQTTATRRNQINTSPLDILIHFFTLCCYLDVPKVRNRGSSYLKWTWRRLKQQRQQQLTRISKFPYHHWLFNYEHEEEILLYQQRKLLVEAVTLRKHF